MERKLAANLNSLSFIHENKEDSNACSKRPKFMLACINLDSEKLRAQFSIFLASRSAAKGPKSVPLLLDQSENTSTD
jgi:hypothetical protein